MNRTLFALAALLTASIVSSPLVVSSFAQPQKKKPVKAATTPIVANPKQENQFVTVDEFVKGVRAPRTAVSVEGYAVSGNRTADGGLRVVVVDSIDHVLSPTDADNLGKGGAKGTVPAGSLAKHPGWQWSAKGMQRFGMYAANGAGRAQKQMHDVVAKVRLTGFATGRAINPVTKIEFQDESGEWKTL